MFHYTPTSASWLSAIESYFAKLTKRRLKRGVLRSLVDLQAAIKRFLAETNENPEPFIWRANPDKIIAAVKREYQALDSSLALTQRLSAAFRSKKRRSRLSFETIRCDGSKPILQKSDGKAAWRQVAAKPFAVDQYRDRDGIFFLDRYVIASFYVIAKGPAMDLILIIIILLFLFGGLGGGYYGYSHYGAGGGIGIFGVILIVVVVLFIFRRGRV